MSGGGTTVTLASALPTPLASSYIITSGIAVGNVSHTEGRFNTTLGNWSHAEGITNLVLGNYSHAEGSGNFITANGAHAEGFGN